MEALEQLEADVLLLEAPGDSTTALLRGILAAYRRAADSGDMDLLRQVSEALESKVAVYAVAVAVGPGGEGRHALPLPILEVPIGEGADPSSSPGHKTPEVPDGGSTFVPAAEEPTHAIPGGGEPGEGPEMPPGVPEDPPIAP